MDCGLDSYAKILHRIKIHADSCLPCIFVSLKLTIYINKRDDKPNSLERMLVCNPTLNIGIAVSGKRKSQYFYSFLCLVPSREATDVMLDVGHDGDFLGCHGVSTDTMFVDGNSIGPPIGT